MTKVNLPGQNVPITLPSGGVNPVWFEKLNNLARLLDPKDEYDFPVLKEGGNEVLTVIGGKTLTGGFVHQEYDNGTPTNGSTITINPSNGLKQKITNNVAGFTIAATTECGDVELRIINGSSAGTITRSGFNYNLPGGDSLDTTDTHQFVMFIYGWGAAGADYLIRKRQA